ncbi:MAG: glutamine amidotransferase [Hydrogenibacillus schlegelii]|uniref:Lipid II isoglutaminyl synthase (glutamine-hydrolyzing) subunit GatD n=1 Tax=Hydrogenibacillus schlegelii TaxID=1484 RepID=A0A947GC19_HYDSH|nr:glutamine amidotransferase [Hydrogenibacillus schlegelii]
MRPLKLKIGHLYPDVLEVYSDRGNVTVLQKRAEWRGIDVQVDRIGIGDDVNLAEYDLLFAGGGEDREQMRAAEDLLRKRDALLKAVASGSVVLAICGSYQLLGRYFETVNGHRIEGVGLLDLYTIGGRRRLTGNVVGKLTIFDFECTVVGYENHSGRTYLGSGAAPLATVVSGHGNNGEDGWEGVAQGTVFGTYLHGPVLAKNPLLADHLLRLALKRRTDRPHLPPLDDEWEWTAHERLVRRVAHMEAACPR